MRWIAALLAAVSVQAANGDVTVTGAFPTDSNGVRINPKLGEPFFVTVLYQVSNQKSAYTFSFGAPSGDLKTNNLSVGVNAPGAYYVRWGTFNSLYDGAYDISITCSASKASQTLHVIPTAGSTAIESFAPQALVGNMSASVSFNRVANKLIIWSPIPTTSVSQTVSSVSVPSSSVSYADGTGQPIGVQVSTNAKQISPSYSIKTTAYSVRDSAALLRTVPMSSLTPIAPANTMWLNAEPLIESTDASVISFAKTSAKSAASNSVYDIALAVYSALLKRSTYMVTSGSPDAVKALRNGGGECGDLSALFVASCRSLGIPARPVSGFYLGDNSWHVWAEFLVPNIGWVPVDPAFALGKRSHSAYPLYFGVIPEMNERIAVCKGFRQTLQGLQSSFVQTDQVFWSQSNLNATSSRFLCHLQVASQQP